MGRLTRAQTQERTRAAVLTAARAEFVERGFRDAKIDRIAERAELTRGAIYSNFPGKRSLYFAVLAEHAERAAAPPAPPHPATDVRAALGAFARAWLGRLPLATDPGEPAWLGRDLHAEITGDEQVRRAFAQLMALSAILLGLGLEQLPGPGQPHAPGPTRPLAGKPHRPGRTEPDERAGPGGPVQAGGPVRLVPLAEMALTVLSGASQLAGTAPGFVEPFQVVQVCEQLADLGLDPRWRPPHLPHVPGARLVDERWPAGTASDALRGTAVRLAEDGVVAVLGLHRLAAIEEAVRAAPAGAAVTVVLTTAADRELGPLVRLVLAELRDGLRQALPDGAWPRLRVGYDGSGAIATAAGIRAAGDRTEAAVRIRGGRIAARAEGRGACHAVASADVGQG
jgi:AcrR family transcriptional regulator